ncbi:MAG: hypothetical protein GY796_16990 [Chloroflexi bacterium]|nr:hypothetical protein [Chloroflexota bacterium]
MSPADPQLIAKQEALKRKLDNREYQSLTGFFLDGVAKLTRKLTRYDQPLPLWYTGIVFTLLIWLLSFLIIMILPGAGIPRFDVFLAGITVMLMASIGVALAEEMYILLMKTLQYTVVDALANEQDVGRLDKWLQHTFNLRRQFVVSIILSLLIALSFVFFWNQVRGGAGLDAYVVGIIVAFQGSISIIMVFIVFKIPNQISHYQFDIYAADPASSEVIQRLSGALNRTMFVLAISLALLTFWLFSFSLLNESLAIFLVVVVWVIIILVFINGHYSLATIIRRVKWRKLNGLQVQITTLEAAGDLTEKATIESINKLMDYHDRIRTTRNSAFDMRAGLGFINSALLPLLAFLLANLTDVFGFFVRLLGSGP